MMCKMTALTSKWCNRALHYRKNNLNANSISLKISGVVQPNMFWNGPPMGAVLPLVPSLIPVHPQALGQAPNIWNYAIPFQRNPVAPDPYTVQDNSFSYSSKSPAISRYYCVRFL